MKIAYKIRKAGTDSNPWIIAVIYDYENWPCRSLAHKGLSEPQVIRDATDTEIKDYKAAGNTRCLFITYENIKGFMDDEQLCEVPEEVWRKVLGIYYDLVKFTIPQKSVAKSTTNIATIK